MTAVMEPQADVVEATPQELTEGVARVLAESGYSYRQLRGQAAVGRFDSPRARKAWMIVSAFDPYVSQADRNR